MGTRWARFMRGLLTASFSVLVAALSHTVGGGSAPATLGVVLAVAFAVPTCILLAGKTLSLVRLTLSVVLSQLALHGLFGIGAGPALSPDLTSAPALTSAPTLTFAAHSHAAAYVDPFTVVGHSTAAMQQDPSMWGAHAVAAVITIIALRRGEASFWGLVALARSVIIAVFPRSLAGVRPVTLDLDAARIRFAIADRLGLRDLGVLLSGRPRRGPPLTA